jgi:hypothetical protein
MHFAKITGVSLVVLIIAGISSLLLASQTKQETGRILSGREMVIVFGDQATGNAYCWKALDCGCSRQLVIKGYTYCATCGSADGGNIKVVWNACCATSGMTNCSETGDKVCVAQNVYGSLDYGPRVGDCCHPCKSIAYTNLNIKCAGNYGRQQGAPGDAGNKCGF